MDYNFLRFIFDGDDVISILLTFKIALFTIVLHGFFGVSIAFLVNRCSGPIKSIIEGIINIPLIFPPIATGLFLLLLLGRNGFIGKFLSLFNLNIIFSFSGLVIASFVAGLPLIVKTIQTSLETFDKNIINAAYSLGKSELVTFITIILPCIKKTVISGLLLSFGRSLGEVGITMMLGGNIRGKTDTISLSIYNSVMDGNYSKALILSALLSLVSILIIFLLNIISNKKS